MNNDKFQSPHGELQNVLALLGTLNPRAATAPAFGGREQAEHMIAIVAEHEGHELQLNPVWAIDHDDLMNSEIVAWSVTADIN